MSRLIRQPATREPVPVPDEGIAALHVACRTLVSASPNIIRSLSVTIPLVDFPVPASAVVGVVERIAAEHGLISTGELDRQWLVAALRRASSPDPIRKRRG